MEKLSHFNPPDEGSSRKSTNLGLIFVSLVLATVVPLLAGWFYFSRVELEPVPVQLGSLETVSGEVSRVNGLIVIDEGDEKNQVVMMALVPRFPTKLYEAVSWKAKGFTEASGGALLWITTQGGNRVFVRRLTLPDVREGRINIGGHPDWSGDVDRVGLLIQGPWQGPVTFESIQIEPRPRSPSMEESLALAGRIWSSLEGWQGGSINFLGVTGRGERFTPTVTVALWCLFAAGFFWVFSGSLPRQARVGSVAAIFLMGWWVLDARWQLTLLQNIEDARAAPEQITNVDANLALSAVKEVLPGKSERIFVISNDPNAFDALRARYLLAPHRVFVGFRSLSELSMLREGDRILVISTPERLQFDTGNQLLMAGETRLKAELISSNVAYGSLFRYLGAP